MDRLRPSRLAVLLALLLALLPAVAGASPVRFDSGGLLDWRVPAAHVLTIRPRTEVRALLRVRLFTAEVVVLPSGRMVIRTIVALRAPYSARGPRPDVIVLPLPGSLPILAAAIAGLALVRRRRRPVP